MSTEAQARAERAESAFTKKTERAADASAAMKEHKANEAHVDTNMQRLRDARLTREAQLVTPPPSKTKAKSKPKAKVPSAG